MRDKPKSGMSYKQKQKPKRKVDNDVKQDEALVKKMVKKNSLK